MTKTYSVRLPITGVIDVVVEALDEESAIHAAMDMELTVDDITEWNTHRQVVQGNIFHGHTNKAEADEQ